MAVPILTNSSIVVNQFRTGTAYTSALQTLPDASLILATDHYEIPESFETMTVIAPRPYTEYTNIADAGGLPTSSDNFKSIYTHFCTNLKWRVPIGVIQGSFPFIFRLVGAPAGMVVEQTIDNSDWSGYGWITWAAPTVGTHEFVLFVFDQEGTVVTVPMALNITDDDLTPTNTIHLDTGAGGGGDGSFSSPFNSITSVAEQVGFDGLPWVLHDGYSEAMPSGFAMQNDEGSALYGDPDAVTRPSLDLTTNSEIIGTGTGGAANEGLSILHLNIDGNSSATEQNPKQVWANSGMDRFVVANVTCTNADMSGDPPSSGNDNNFVLRTNGSASDPNLYQLFKNIYIDGYTSQGDSNNGGCLQMMDTQWSLMEDITLGTQIGNVSVVCVFKHGANDNCLRLLRSKNITGERAVSHARGASDNPGFENRRVIIEYCKLQQDSGAQVLRLAEGQGEPNDDHADNVVRRCTLASTSTLTTNLANAGIGSSMLWKHCIGVNSNNDILPPGYGNWSVVKTENLEGTSYGGVGLDSEADLSSGDSNYGKRGYQIA